MEKNERTCVERTVIVVADPQVAQREVVPPTPVAKMAIGEESIGLNWPAAKGKIYRVQYKNALSDAEWTDLWPDVMADSSTGSISLLKAGPQRFYRIVLMNE